jgi:hypothetical protein
MGGWSRSVLRLRIDADSVGDLLDGVESLRDFAGHGEERVDHSRIFRVRDRYAGLLQPPGISLAFIAERIAFGRNDQRRR